MAFSMSMSATPALGARTAYMGSKLRARAPVRVASKSAVAARANIPGEQLVRPAEDLVR